MANNSLGNDAFLSKIDRLRATNVGSLIPLPQVIVVGDQSSGKSSALESLTGFAFPRAATLCTRYATQISCIRAPEKRVVVSIIPRMDANDQLKTRLQAFRRELTDMDDACLAQIFHDANVAMGIRMVGVDDDDDDGASAFSEDTLKIDIEGPDQTHLTLIDVPGIFRIPTPDYLVGLTTDSDIQLVRNMVKRYMENSRTIILTVIPCNIDIANQEILRLAAEADPEGLRTMGVLTKPDLATERATQDAVLELLNGQRNVLKLGYCVLKNRSADDHTSSAAERLASERAFFQAPPWSTCSSSTALGTDALRNCLRGLVLDISKREMPHVRSEIESRRRICAEQLAALGSPRSSEITQRQYLVDIAVRVQDITKSALNGYYAGDNGLFQKQPALRLITKLIRLNEAFADTFWKRGHVQHFRDNWTDDGEALLAPSEQGSSGDAQDGDAVVLEADEDLSDIVVPDYDCPEPEHGPLMELIRTVYMESRGPELGTFNGTVLASVFTEVTKKWEPLVLDHTSKAIAIVHDYIRKLLDEVCTDPIARDQLWDVLLRHELRNRYRSVMAHAEYLLHIERSGLPMTFNHYFNSTVQKKRHDHILKKLKKRSQTMEQTGYNEYGEKCVKERIDYIPVDQLENMTIDMNNSEHVCEDLLDTVESYYKVSRKRFVDTFCQHVVYHKLLDGPDSPLKLLSPGLILQLTPDQLSDVAGEDPVTCNRRQVLGRQLESLEEAARVLAAR